MLKNGFINFKTKSLLHLDRTFLFKNSISFKSKKVTY